MPRLLIVEDDARIAAPLKRSLELDSHVVDLAVDGLEGWTFVSNETYDLVLMDLNLPKLDGLALCRRMREQGMLTPVLMLTARDTSADTIVGLDAGADDYVVKPFELAVVKARIRSLLRRPPDYASPLLNILDLELDLQAKQVACRGKLLSLTAKEFIILEHLARHPGQTFRREELLQRLWGWDAPQSDVVKAHVKSLRRKVLDGGGRDPIETVYGFGYRIAPVD